MKITTLSFSRNFHLVARTSSGQAAVMVVQPGASVGGQDNRHSGADQWLFVVAGTGAATVDGKELRQR